MRLYLHIPFCVRKCPYCDFHSVVADEETKSLYINALMNEIDLLKRVFKSMGEEILSLYFGGGTPSIYPPAELGRIIRFCKRELTVAREAEITVEINPGSWKKKELIEAARMGFNRLSIGAQSFDPETLRILGRNHTHLDVLRLAKSAMDLDRFDVNLDLIYGVPQQTLATWRQTLEMAVGVKPHHLSIYALNIPEGSEMDRKAEEGAWRMPAEDEIADMYDLACRLLGKAGYHHYEISNFALPGKECAHNIAYWERSAYIGIGSGSHSFLPSRLRWSNLKNISTYINTVNGDMLPVEHLEFLTREEAWEEEVMLSLRMSRGLDLCALEEFKNMRVLSDTIDGWQREGLVWRKGGRLGLSERGMLVSNQIIASLLGG